MKMFSVLAAAAILVAMVLSGCATAPRTAPMQSNLDPLDAAYMARVEHEAMRRGVRVQWVNPPRRELPQPPQLD